MVSPSFLVDSDNGLGSPFGDIDDGFAITALLKARADVSVLSSVFGNTFERWAHRNNVALANVLGFDGKILRGARSGSAERSEVSAYLAQARTPLRVLALGPLTNVALALRENRDLAHVSEVLFVGTNYLRRLPPTRFFDFNTSRDPRAVREVFDSSLPLTIVPCDVARTLRMRARDLDRWPDASGEYVRSHAARWFFRARVLKISSTVPIWDLVAALYALKPDLFRVEDTTASIRRSAQIRYHEGTRKLRVVTGFDSEILKDFFFSLL